nr:PREDICTED: uncharacterized protein LOC109041647 [Bemisia tabaci]
MATGSETNTFHRSTLLAKIQNLIQLVHESKDDFKKILTEENVKSLYPRYEMLDKYRSRFEEFIDQAIEFNSENPDNEIDFLPLQSEFNKILCDSQMMYLRVSAKRVANENASGNSSTLINTTAQMLGPKIRLPKLELTHFSGQIENWRTFYNLFKASVHDSTHLLEVEKFQYLIGSLRGDALALIKGLDITAANYAVAWNLLCKRYQSERRHVFHHFTGLLDLPEIKNSNQVHTLLTKLREHTQALTALGHESESYDGMLTAVLIRKLSPGLWRRFEDFREAADNAYPKLAEIIAFLEKELMFSDDIFTSRKEGAAPEKVSKTLVATSSNENSGKKKKTKQADSVLATATEAKTENHTPNCLICPEKHWLNRCPLFLRDPPDKRLETIRNHHLCQLCFSPKHELDECPRTFDCHLCHQKHSVYLHGAAGLAPKDPKPQTDEKPHVAMVSSSSQEDTLALLATVQVEVCSAKGSISVRGILDLACQSTLLATSCAKSLQLPVDSNLFSIVGVSGNPVKTRGSARITLKTKGKVLAKNHVVTIVDKIINATPSRALSPEIRARLAGLPLADEFFDKPAAAEILIGVDLLPRLLCGETIFLGEGFPTALKTKMGYALFGPAPILKETNVLMVSALNEAEAANTESLQESLQKFWEVEEPRPSAPICPPDHPAEILFRETTIRLSSGRYQVRLPFAEPPETLGASFPQALTRFRNLERQFRSKPDFKENYAKMIQGHMDAGQLTPAPPGVLDGTHYVMPHSAVIKETSSTTKFRIVNDASAKTSSGVSLNDILHVGPNILKDIREVILNFRRHSIVFSCDIRQMYLQVALHPDDQRYHLIIWRFHETEPLRLYQYTNVTFGVASSAFLAVRTLRELASQHKEQFPNAYKVIMDEIYADDAATGSDTLENTVQLRQELIDLLALGKFQLRKWFSNDPRLLDGIPSEHLEVPSGWNSGDSPAFSILGIRWLPRQDVFLYKVNTIERPFTKRGALSLIATIFDPLGWLAPAVLPGKNLIQHLWLQKIGWDEPLPTHLHTMWGKFLAELPALEEIRIPRHFCPQGRSIQVMGFSDASLLGYSAVVYARFTDANGQLDTALIAAKTKVAPLKMLSIPRLELCSAYLLTTLLEFIQPILSKNYQIEKVTLWSDSSVTLQWIQTPPHKLKTFVANRVAHVQERFPNAEWRYVKSSLNPADIASRGVSAPQLVANELWWKGPPFLK